MTDTKRRKTSDLSVPVPSRQAPARHFEQAPPGGVA